MRRYFPLLLVLFATPARAPAYLEVSPVVPTLGRVVKQSDRIVVLEVDRVSREQQIIVYKKVADLKGKDPDEVVKHKLTDGYHPREARTVLDWAEPGERAICFYTGQGSVTCIGRYWYLCSAGTSPWSTMIAGRPEMSYAYSGSVTKLRDHITAILADREVTITALKYEVLGLAPGPGKWVERKLDHWATYEAISCGRLMRGKEWPVWRLKASFKTQTNMLELVPESLTGKTNFIVGDGAGTADDVPGLVKALGHETARVRVEAADDLGLIGPPAAGAVPALLKLAEQDADPLVRIAAATRGFTPRCVLFDSWYASLDTFKQIRGYGWVFLARFKGNRLVRLDRGRPAAIEALPIAAAGTVVWLPGFGLVKVFRTVAPDGDAEYWVTNDTGLDELRRVVFAELAWSVEEFHRGLKQFTGVERCQTRMALAQRNHIGCAIRAFVRLEWHRFTTGVSWFEAKMRIIRDAVRTYLARPTITLPRPATA